MTALENIRLPKGHLIGIQNAKTQAGEALGFLTGVMYLAPHALSGFNVCASSSPDCRRDCLYSSGRGKLPTTKDARLTRTRLYFEAREAFMQKLIYEIAALMALAFANGLRLAIRLNGTSDILWERVTAAHTAARHTSIMQEFPLVQFYDYTKHEKRRAIPGNYHLTFSAQSHTLEKAFAFIAEGRAVCAVVSEATHARLLEGATRSQSNMRFHDAASHDARFLDPPNSVGLLVPKGTLRRETPQTSTLILSEQAAIELGARAFRAHNATRVSRLVFRGEAFA